MPKAGAILKTSVKINWLKRYRKFENGIPVDDTIARIIRVIRPKQLNQAFLNWVNDIRIETGKPQIAIDGKTLRHSYDGDKQTALHSITAWSKGADIMLAQLKSSGKKMGMRRCWTCSILLISKGH